MPTSNYLEEAILNWVDGTAPFPASPANIYVALSLTDPLEDGSGITEPNGADGYARQLVSLAAIVQGPDDATRATDAVITFGPATNDWGTVEFFAIFDALVLGNMLWYSTLAASADVTTGQSFRFPAGALIIGQR